MKLNKLPEVLFCVGLLASIQVTAAEFTVNSTQPTSTIPIVEKGIINKLYQGLGIHDGSSKIYGIFLPQIAKGNNWTWWLDTGSIYGAGSGVRQVLNVHWLDQGWFWGSYCYFESPSWIDFPEPQWKRLNIGFELAASNIGKLTINHYRDLGFNPRETLRASRRDDVFKDISGTSVRFSSDYFQKIKPFVALSKNEIIDNSNSTALSETAIKNIWSLAVGSRYQLTQFTDLEIKVNFFDSAQSRMHMGLRTHLNPNNGASGYFNNHFYRAPDRSIPHYSNAWGKTVQGFLQDELFNDESTHQDVPLSKFSLNQDPSTSLPPSATTSSDSVVNAKEGTQTPSGYSDDSASEIFASVSTGASHIHTVGLRPKRSLPSFGHRSVEKKDATSRASLSRHESVQ